MRTPLCPATARRIITVCLLRVPGRSFVEVANVTAATRYDSVPGIDDANKEAHGGPLHAVNAFVPDSSTFLAVLTVSRLWQPEAQRFRWTI
jgi:hypothetical protein